MTEPSEAPVRWQLVALDGRFEGTVFPLTGAPTRVGRIAGNDIVLGDPTVSRSHCVLMQEGGHLFLEDTMSCGGTFVNDARVDRAPLHPGDVIQIGQLRFRLDPAPSTAPARSA